MWLQLMGSGAAFGSSGCFNKPKIVPIFSENFFRKIVTSNNRNDQIAHPINVKFAYVREAEATCLE